MTPTGSHRYWETTDLQSTELKRISMLDPLSGGMNERTGFFDSRADNAAMAASSVVSREISSCFSVLYSASHVASVGSEEVEFRRVFLSIQLSQPAAPEWSALLI